MKKKLGAKNLHYPTLTVIVGVNVNEKPNYLTVAWAGILGMDSLYIALGKSHYSNRGIVENAAFSINIPSVKLVKETDYCGMYSGRKVDKSNVFKTFYGKLGNAPMIEECPVNMECKLVQKIEFNDHDIFIGKINETYCGSEFMTDHKPDLMKIQPILFSFIDSTYWEIGNGFAKAWSVGKDLKK